MAILSNCLLSSFLGKCPPFFTILSAICILESGHPALTCWPFYTASIPTTMYHWQLCRWRKWRACDVGEAEEELENDLWPFHGFTYITAHSPTLSLLHLRHSSFSNPSIASPTSQLILQPFHHITYITAHSPTLPLLHLRHSSFSNPSFASPTSHALYLRHLTSLPCWREIWGSYWPEQLLFSMKSTLHCSICM